MINSAALTGRLTKDIDLKYSGNGTAIASFNLAVNRSFKTQDGQDVDFINCVAFKKTAETMANHLQKGSLIGVEGRIQTRNYENQQGQRVYVTEIIVGKFSFLESKNQSNNNSQGKGQLSSQGNYQGNSQGNFNNNQSGYNQFQQSGDPIEISDDDLPF